MDESVVKELERAATGQKLKLSEAIRIGARLRPQAIGVFFEDGKSCAIGAAMEAIGVPYTERMGCTGYPPVPQMAVDAFHYILRDGERFTDFGVEVHRRNDRGDTRESIADWLAERGL